MKVLSVTSLLLVTIPFFISAQDSLPKHSKKYKVTIEGMTGIIQKGYLGGINDSVLYVSPAVTAVRKQSPNASWIKAVDFNQINIVRLKRKGSTGRGLLYGALAGMITGVIAGFLSGDDPPCHETPYDPNNPWGGLGNAFCDAFRLTAGEKAVAGGTFGMVTGGLVGVIIGALAKKKFIINGRIENFHAMQLSVLERVYGGKTK